VKAILQEDRVVRRGRHGEYQWLTAVSRGKADVLCVADSCEVMRELEKLL
jgi:hypothetical protein